MRYFTHSHTHTRCQKELVTGLLFYPLNLQQSVIWINSDRRLVKQGTVLTRGRLDDLFANINIWMESLKYVVFPRVRL